MPEEVSKTVTTTSNDTDGGRIRTTEVSTSPGYKTSEFWQSIGATLAGLLIIVYGIVNHDKEVMWAGAGLTGLSVSGYSIGRGLAKKT